MEDLRDKLPKIRKILGLNQTEFGHLIGVPNVTISYWEHKKFGIKLSMQKKIIDKCKELGLDIWGI